MSFFNYVDPTDYELTDKDMLRCCYDEVVAEYTDTCLLYTSDAADE